MMKLPLFWKFAGMVARRRTEPVEVVESMCGRMGESMRRAVLSLSKHRRVV